MKIAIVTPFLPTPATGGKRLLLEIIKGLSEKNEIFLLSRIEPWETGGVKELEKYCTIALLHEFASPRERHSYNFLKITASYRALAVKAKKALKGLNVDIVHVSFADLGLFLHKTGAIKTPMVLDTMDVNTLVAQMEFRTAKGLWPKLKMGVWLLLSKWAETYTIGRFDMITTRSPADTRALQGFNPKVPVVTVRLPVQALDKPVPRKEREPGCLLFVGAMHREFNVRYVRYFYDNILPIIRKRTAGIVFYVVGDRPPDELLDLAKRDEGFKVTGFVEDIESFYKKAMVFVSPVLIGGGVMIKNLEAMAHGLPVVTTTLGNGGIEAVSGRDILVADKPEDFASSVIRLLEDEKLHGELSANSIAFIRKNFNKDAIIKVIENAYRDAIRLGSGAGR